MIQTSDHSVLNHLLEGCQIIGFDFRYLFVNDSVVGQARKSRGELVGHAMTDVYPGIDATPMFAVLKRCMIDRAPAELENEFTYPDGTTRWFALKMEPVPEGVFILSIDMTERKRAELELQNQLRRVEALREIDLAIIGNSGIGPALQVVAKKVLSTLHVDAAAIHVLNPETDMLEFAAGHGFGTRDIEGAVIRPGEGAAGRAVVEQRTIVERAVGGDQEPPARSALIAEEKFVSVAAVPLIAKEKVLGVLEVFGRAPMHSEPSWLDFLHSLAGQASIAIESGRLFLDLQRANSSLVFAYDTTIEGWSRALDLRDHETEGHTARVAEITVALARMAGLDAGEIVHLRRGTLLHDIGKMGVPDTILHKQGELTGDEWAIMRRHPTYAYEMLFPIEYLRPALSIPHYHHERWDGAGYPQGLKGEEIPLAARLFAVVDVWDALRSDRPYRPAWTEERALAHIRGEAGRQFDPAAVELFMRFLSDNPQRSIQYRNGGFAGGEPCAATAVSSH